MVKCIRTKMCFRSFTARMFWKYIYVWVDSRGFIGSRFTENMHWHPVPYLSVFKMIYLLFQQFFDFSKLLVCAFDMFDYLSICNVESWRWFIATCRVPVAVYFKSRISAIMYSDSFCLQLSNDLEYSMNHFYDTFTVILIFEKLHTIC